MVIFTLYRAPHLSANPPASLIAFAARFTPSITLLPYAADWPVCPLMLEKCTTVSWENAGAVIERIVATSRGVQRFEAEHIAGYEALICPESIGNFRPPGAGAPSVGPVTVT